MIVGIDGNWILHRAYSVRPNGAPFLAAAMVKKALRTVGATSAVVAIDCSKDDGFRRQVYPAYKANRPVTGAGAAIPEFKNQLDLAGILWMQEPPYEADDILCSLAHQGPCINVVCDKDAYQYVRPGVQLFNPYPSPSYVDQDEVERRTGLPPRLQVAYQTLIGDKVDNVPSVMGKAKAKKGLLEHGSLKAWLIADKQLRSQVDRLRTNQKLVKLVSTIEVKTKPVKGIQRIFL